MITAALALRDAAQRLAAAGVDTSRLDARLLLGKVLEIDPNSFVAKGHLELSPAEEANFEGLLARRINREPISHLLGRRGFWTHDFLVTADTLDPRPDTESVIEAVLAEIDDRRRPLRLLDFGTGTGCIVLTLLSELGHASGLGVDKSPAALEVAAHNAEALGLAGRTCFRQGHWGEGLEGEFDVIVSNPPYIPDGDIDGLEPEVARFEPRLALAGGPDGLACYRALVPHIARLLAPGGIAALEVGEGQAAAVAALLTGAGLALGPTRCDLGGVERCVIARRNAGI
ncbi:Release factor glutamine methyltransferase [Candidatus Terasakiella magnetica]|nr:Release factor glutamine methyltransferase [Candidatus Terasakiella magnetica]